MTERGSSPVLIIGFITEEHDHINYFTPQNSCSDPSSLVFYTLVFSSDISVLLTFSNYQLQVCVCVHD